MCLWMGGEEAVPLHREGGCACEFGRKEAVQDVLVLVYTVMGYIT